jgi:hypothetical protein
MKNKCIYNAANKQHNTHNYTLEGVRYRSMADKKLPVLDGRAAGGVSMVSALVRREFAMLLPSFTLATAMSRNNMASMAS